MDKEIRTLKDIFMLHDKNDDEIDITMFTCYHCDEWKECRFAFDAYNTDGDCLADK